MLLRYYKIFKELNPKIRIAVFTLRNNDSQDDEQTGMNQVSPTDRVTADELQAIMDDYNGMFHTNFLTDNFSAYYDDINLRMKKKRADERNRRNFLCCRNVPHRLMPRNSIRCMDKNLKYHGLFALTSRTNRVLNEKKRFGVVCFHQTNVDKAGKLFSKYQCS